MPNTLKSSCPGPARNSKTSPTPNRSCPSALLPERLSRRAFLALPGLAMAADSEPGFVPLFDGKSLDGWSVAEGPESAFTVKDGAIEVHHGSNFPTWLRSAKRYENFDFRG